MTDRITGEEARRHTKMTHTVTPYCDECSKETQAWVKWPCRGSVLAAEVERLTAQLDEAVRLLRLEHLGDQTDLEPESCQFCAFLAAIDKEPEA